MTQLHVCDRRRPAADAVQRDRASAAQQSAHRVVRSVVRASGRLPRRRVPHGRAVGAAHRPPSRWAQLVQLDDGV